MLKQSSNSGENELMVCEIMFCWHRAKLLCAALQLSLLTNDLSNQVATKMPKQRLTKPKECDRSGACIACRVPPSEKTEAAAPGSSLCRSAIRSPTFISMGLRKNRHFSFLEGNGTSRTKRPCLYFKDTSATHWGGRSAFRGLNLHFHATCLVHRSSSQADVLNSFCLFQFINMWM